MDRNNTVWIIGANSDIAKSFVKKYISEFKNVILASKNQIEIHEFIQKTDAEKIETFELDICDELSVDKFIEAAPVPDIVIIFAGYLQYDGMQENFSSENIIRTYRTNAEGPSILIEKLYKLMSPKHGGTVVALSSCAGERGKGSNRIYAASKAAMSVYMEGFMQAAEKDNIKTVLIKLGRVDTKMLKKSPIKNQQLFCCSSEQAADFIMRAIRKNKSQICCYSRIWKYIMKIYKIIPLKIYNRINI